jgi:hypothetical protein
MRLLYYPPQTGIVDDRTIGIGSHTEYVKRRDKKIRAFGLIEEHRQLRGPFLSLSLQRSADGHRSASRFCGNKVTSTPYRF